MKQAFSIVGLLAFVGLFVLSLLIAVGAFKDPGSPTFSAAGCQCPSCITKPVAPFPFLRPAPTEHKKSCN